MVRCWKYSETSLDNLPCMHGGPVGSSRVPPRVLWISLTAALLVVSIALIVIGKFAVLSRPQSSLQGVRITSTDRPAALINQSALVDKQNNIVTYSVTSQANQTSTVLFDIKHGLVCYKPENQNICFLRQMEMSDYENMHVLLNESEQQVTRVWLVGNETQRHTEFLGVLGASRVDTSTFQKPLQTLCHQRPVYWTRRCDSPRERLIYFCIDICFPSNICVSVCFYYLPE